MGGVANQFALTEILAFLISLPVMFLTEGFQFGTFLNLLFTEPKLQKGLAISGMSFYLYNELATLTIKATGAVTSSVANTAKRVIVMVYMAAVTGKVLTEEQKIGAAIAIGGVLVYSVIDDVMKMVSGGGKDKKKKKPKAAHAAAHAAARASGASERQGQKKTAQEGARAGRARRPLRKAPRLCFSRYAPGQLCVGG